MLDDVVVFVYLLAALVLRLRGAELAVALAAAGVHFLLTRFTDYRPGAWRVIPFRVHAFIELGEGIALLAAGYRLMPHHVSAGSLFFIIMGVTQLNAFAFSDYGPARKAGATARP